MAFTARICPICGSENIVEKNGSFYCRACGVTLDAPKNNEEEQRKLISQVNAEDDLKLSPPRFDDALEKFERLIKDYPEWYAPYWGYVRAKYGIKYEDDLDGKSIPSCYNGHYQDFRNDKFFKKAVQLADTKELKAKLISEGDKIAHTWKMWEEKASKNDYDIFLSFKATDEFGEKTRDQEEMLKLYSFLTSKGYKVFFSPVSMKEYVGESYYDAFIFNALEKAQVLIVYGTKPEYFSTTWVENEWTRYLKHISEGKKNNKSLIVIYEGFNPSQELPRKLSNRQMLDGTSRTLYPDILDTIAGIMKKDVEEEVVPAKGKKAAKVEKEPDAVEDKRLKELEEKLKALEENTKKAEKKNGKINVVGNYIGGGNVISGNGSTIGDNSGSINNFGSKVKGSRQTVVNGSTTNYGSSGGIMATSFGVRLKASWTLISLIFRLVAIVTIWVAGVLAMQTGNSSFSSVFFAYAVPTTAIILIKTFYRIKHYTKVKKILGILIDLSVGFYAISLVVVSIQIGTNVTIVCVVYALSILFGLILRPRQKYYYTK